MDDSHPATGRQLMVARVADRMVGFVASEIAQVLPMLPLWRPPTSPAPLRGFASVLGGVMPVLSLRALLGLGGEEPPSVYAHILKVARVGGQAAGLLVDRADGFAMPAKLGALERGDTLNGCATAVFHYQGGVAHLIHASRLLSAAEGAVLAALTAEADRRRADWMVAA